MTERPIDIVLRQFGQECVAAEQLTARAEHMERMRTVVMAEIVKEQLAGGGAITKAQETAKADPRYKEHLEEQREVSDAAGKARAAREHTRARLHVWQMTAAFARDQAKAQGER